MKKYTLTFVSFALAIICLLAFQIIGSEVAPDGRLVEAFFLIPFAYLFLLVSLFSALIVTFMKFKSIRNC